MQSKAATVTAYLKEVPDDRKAVLKQLRKICLDILKGYDECMDYGMPCYKNKKTDEIEIAFASQKNYISLYILKHSVINKNKSLLKGLSVGKSCIKYTKTEKMDFHVIHQLIIDSFSSADKVC